MYVMGNDNGPRDYDEFPQALAPSEIEITDTTSCTDKQYVTLVNGYGIKAVGVSENLSFTEDTLSVPKIEAGTVETDVLKTTVNTPTEELPISLACSDGCFADSNLKYNPATMTLTIDNATIRSVNAECVSVDTMSFNNLEADNTNIGTANVTNLNLAWKKACYYVEGEPFESDIYEMNVGPVTSICIPAGTTICGTDCNFQAISKYFFPLVECTTLERRRPILSNGFLCVTQQTDSFYEINGVKSGLEHGAYLIFQEDSNNRFTMGAGTNNVYFRKDFIFSGIFSE